MPKSGEPKIGITLDRIPINDANKHHNKKSSKDSVTYSRITRNWTDGSSHWRAQRQVSSDGLIYSRAPPAEQQIISFDESLQHVSGAPPPTDQMQSNPSFPAQTYSAVDNWLEEPLKSGPYNNIQSFAWTETEEPATDTGEIGGQYAVDKWSVGYYDTPK